MNRSPQNNQNVDVILLIIFQVFLNLCDFTKISNQDKDKEPNFLQNQIQYNRQMSETSNNKGDNDERKRHRRSRKDGHERTYVCSQCQKSYLSNAALYTHTKTKHQGVSEKSIHKEGEAQQLSENQMHNAQPMGQKQEREPVNTDHSEELLEELRNYLKKYFPQRNKGSSVRLITEGLAPHVQEFATQIFSNWEERAKRDHSKSGMKIDDTFGMFLTLLNSKVSSTCMNFLVRLFYYMKEGLRIQHRRNLHCENEGPQELPNDFNGLVLNRRIPPDNVEEDELMNNSIIVCKVLEYYGHWLYEERFTDYKLIPKYPES